MQHLFIPSDACTGLSHIPDSSVQAVITSPPYWGQRDYGHNDQIGLEPTADEYVDRLTQVFHHVKRVLHPTGVLWLNIGDTFNGYVGNRLTESTFAGKRAEKEPRYPKGYGLLEKKLKYTDLIGVPWRVARSLQDDGWYLRMDVIWNKITPMPESVKSRPTKAHEYIFMLTKKERDIKFHKQALGPGLLGSVWDIAPSRIRHKHSAMMPEELVSRCLMLSTDTYDTVLDPFSGSGTTAVACFNHDRRSINIDICETYIVDSVQRLQDAGCETADIIML